VTDKPINKKPKRSESTRALQREKAKAQGKQRTDDVQVRVREIMATIEREIVGNEGIYPHNGGALSKAEVCRRANVHPTTLFSPTQRVFGGEVQDWLDAIKKENVTGRLSVRRTLAERQDDWKKLYEGLAQSHRDTELELQQTQADLKKTSDELSMVKRENARLTSTLATFGHERIVPLKAKGK
jgi:hypothetical protein